MREIINGVRQLYTDKRLEGGLLIRLILLALVTILTTGTVVIDFFRGLPFWGSIGFMILGFLLGYIVMSKSTHIHWDPYKEKIMVGRLDIIVYSIVIAYYTIEYVADRYIDTHYADAFLVSGFSLAFFTGVIIGRFIGILRRIYKLSMSDTIPRI